MQTIVSGIVLGLLVLTALPAEEPASSVEDKRFGPTYQFVFFSVLEGLYREGATQTDVQRVLMKRSAEHGYEHFIYGCPICTPVLLAFQLYEKRPAFGMYKPISPTDHKHFNATFGTGFSEPIQRGLHSDQAAVRLETLHHLIAKWTNDRMAAMDLPQAQREALQKQLEEGRKQGMKTLETHKKDPARMKWYAPGYADLEECALCNAACRIDFDGLPERSRAE